MEGRVKGDTLLRIWKTFGARGHAEKVAPVLPEGLARELDSGFILATEWYPIALYLALYDALLKLMGYEEVVATAHDSVMRGLTVGTWKVFVPVLAGLAPEKFCQRGVKRFELVYNITFEPGEAHVTMVAGGADVRVVGAPWSAEPAWRGGVSGGLLTIPSLAGMVGDCHAFDDAEGSVRFELRWRKK